MVYIVSLEFCCGVLEIGDFPHNTENPEEDKLKKGIENEIINTCVEEALDNGENKYHNFFIATTQKDEQVLAGKVLKDLGFKGKVFKNRTGNTDLVFWSRRGLPREIKKKITEEYNIRKKDYDRW